MKTRLLITLNFSSRFCFSAAADQITFSFISPPGHHRNFSASHLGANSAGPGLNVLVSDTTSGRHVPLGGILTASTDPAFCSWVCTEEGTALRFRRPAKGRRPATESAAQSSKKPGPT